MSRDLWIIRHGETAHNARRILQPPETPLSELGRAQAARLAERLADAGVARIVSSDLARAAQTAEAIAARTGALVTWQPLLHERSFGDLRGTAYADLGFDPFADGYAPPGGETWEVFRARVRDAWREIGRLAAETDGSLAVVTHGLVCRELVAVHLEIPAGLDASRATWANTCVTVAEAAPPWRARLVADASHLADLAAAGAAV